MTENRFYTEEEEAFIVRHAESFTSTWIAEKLGRSPRAIRLKIFKMGMQCNKIDRWTPAEISFLREHYQEKGTRWVSEKMDRTYLAVVTKAQELGLQKKRKKLACNL